jgi:hypothetical protein
MVVDYEARTQGSFVEKKVSSVTFHYRNADPVFGLFQGTFPRPSSRASLLIPRCSQGVSSDVGEYARVASHRRPCRESPLTCRSWIALTTVIHRARRTSRSVRRTRTRARSCRGFSTSTPTPSSACAQETTRPTRTWYALLSLLTLHLLTEVCLVPRSRSDLQRSDPRFSPPHLPSRLPHSLPLSRL